MYTLRRDWEWVHPIILALGIQRQGDQKPMVIFWMHYKLQASLYYVRLHETLSKNE